jgi:hypothetical protein
LSATTDPREHRWLIAAGIDSTSLNSAAAEVGLRSERFIGNFHDAAIITAPAAWNSVERLIVALELAYATPCVARYENTNEGEVLQ